MANAPVTLTRSHPAVIATSPAREPFRVIETSGLPYRIQVSSMTVVVAAAVAMFVVTKIRLAVSSVSSPLIETVEQPLNPNHANQRMNTPRAASVRLWPGIALTEPSSPYFPMRAPRNFAPISAQTPPTM